MMPSSPNALQKIAFALIHQRPYLPPLKSCGVTLLNWICRLWIGFGEDLVDTMAESVQLYSRLLEGIEA